ncbi:putative NAD-dependent histone deacetylase [Rhypophila decipiens]|uniref:NAD-dependent histone deacetylase n=1 Tax=Rhypophila decipiens TaxID=261697 RepID=A0AAN7BAI6_9PEZI|nr:putative NAD-dependent histone deacetylase [Rhypophila decipiens]
MPTTQVVPGAESELQDIANSLWKSRKVVVITGAGISTNSGIPDFRSEGGLYSLIQAQFAAAAAEDELIHDGESNDCDASLELDRNRPAKRRRLSRDNVETISQGSRNGDSIAVAMAEEEVVAEIQCLGDSDTSGLSDEGDASKAAATTDHSAIEVRSHDDVIMVDSELQNAPEPSDEPPGGAHPDPSTPFKTLPAAVDELTALTPLPSPFLPRPTAPTNNGTAGQLTSSPPSLTHDHSRFPSDSDQSFPHTVSSSPLSSPPHFLLDPYQQPSQRTSASPSPSSPQTRSSSGSESDGSGRSSSSTPVLTSQSSYTSFATRNSLPNMKGKDLFDAQIWSCPIQTSVFYTFITSLRQKARDAQPTAAHRFVSILRDSRKLVRCYTQNIDLLEERVGLSTSLELGPGNRYRFSARSGRTSGGARGSIKEAEASSLSQTDATEDTKQVEDSMSTPSGTQAEARSQSTSVNGGDTSEPSSQAKENDIPLSQLSTTTTTKAPPNRGVECVCVHGSLSELRCFLCGRTSSWDEESRESDTLAGRQPQCPHCERATAAREERGKRALGVGKLRPNIVLYGEAHPQEQLIGEVVRHDLSLGPDMLLILGTSLRVHGLKTLVREFAKAVHDRGGKVVFVNFTKPPDSVWSDFIDYWVQWDCDAWVSDMEQRKPALWLPPGAALPETEKPKKATKASRKSGAGEMSDTKDDSTVAKSRRSTARIGRKGRPKKEASSITEAVSANTIPSSGSPPGQGPYLSKTEAQVEKEAPGLDSPPLLPPATSPVPVSRTEDSTKAAPPSGRRSKTSSATAQPSSSSTPPTTSSVPVKQSTLAAVMNASQSAIPSEGMTSPAPGSSPPAQGSQAAKTKSRPPRPMAVRDDKLNGAYLTWKIRQDLKRITGQPPLELPVFPSTIRTGSTAPPPPKQSKRSRKSAPAALASSSTSSAQEASSGLDNVVDQPITADQAEEDEDMNDGANFLFPGAVPDVAFRPVPIARPPVEPVDQESSISALVKSRKRKRQSWKMVRGVEQEAELARQTAALAALAAPTPIVAAPKANAAEPVKRRMTLPPLRDPAAPATPGFRPYSEFAFQHGFSSTDRLIAKLNSELDPFTPAPANNMAQGRPSPAPSASRPRPEPIGPKVTSPGPDPEIALSVGSPPGPQGQNTFYYEDPMLRRLRYPPQWLEQSYNQSQFALRDSPPGHQEMEQHHPPAPGQGGFGRHQSPASVTMGYGPEDQLRREQEAAMVMSMMGRQHQHQPPPEGMPGFVNNQLMPVYPEGWGPPPNPEGY